MMISGRSYQTDLARLLADICHVPAALNTRVHGLKVDSRKVVPGDLFIALSGQSTQAADHIPEAIQRGANAIIIEGKNRPGQVYEEAGVVELAIEGIRDKQGLIASRFFQHPDQDMSVIGVTGTNGKTSVSNYIAQYFDRRGIKSGVIGTLGWGVIEQASSSQFFEETGMTTPGIVDVYRCLASLRDAGVKVVAMEVSSHALTQGRVEGIRFEGAVFTNLSRDHLDYHGSMEAYAEAKSLLFQYPGLVFAVLNADDPESRNMQCKIAPDVKVLHYSIQKAADVCATSVDRFCELKATIKCASHQFELSSHLIGRFNLSNLLAVAAVALAKGQESGLEEGLPAIQPVAGRMQYLGKPGKPGVVIDYAHTPDALENVLITLGESLEGKLIVVFGCGGDRDRGKRAEMGRIAERFSDRVILTDDNPRFEDPETVVKDILEGISDSGAVTVVHDRAMAIKLALETAVENDCVLIAGKGHERYQDISGRKRHFSDLECASGLMGLNPVSGRSSLEALS